MSEVNRGPVVGFSVEPSRVSMHADHLDLLKA